jgi:hypothetical protein
LGKIKKKLMKHTIRSLLYIVGSIIAISICSKIGNVDAQSFDKTISFPEVKVASSNVQNSALDEEFILINNHDGNNINKSIKVVSPDFGFSYPIVNLIEGKKYTINALNDAAINYNSISIKMAPVTHISSDIRNLTEADPEDSDNMKLGSTIQLYNKVLEKDNEGIIDFTMPTNIVPGKYVLYLYLYYPDGITGVFSNIATVTNSDENNIPIKSNIK